MDSKSTHREIPKEFEQKIEQFDEDWGKPSAPSIEQLLEDVREIHRPVLLRELLFVEFELSLRQEAARMLEQHLAQFPEKAKEWLLARYLPRFQEYESIICEVADEVLKIYKNRFFGNYTIIEELGRGGMGIVYRAKHNQLGTCAIKIINRKLVNSQEALARFAREIKIHGKINRLPNVAKPFNADVWEGTPFLVMELVEGISLAKWRNSNLPCNALQSTKALTQIDFTDTTSNSSNASNPSTNLSTLKKKEAARLILEICTIIRNVAQGLQALHDAGIVHRDIKPGNLMLLAAGDVKILDLGLAKIQEETVEDTAGSEPQTLQGQYLGTPGYIAPEQEKSSATVDARADIYSLGCTLFYLLKGRSPTENPTNAISIIVPPKLQSILDRMLYYDFDRRFQKSSDVAAALDSFICTAKKSRWIKSIIVGTLIVLLGFLTLFGVLCSNKHETLPMPTQSVRGNGEPTPEQIAILNKLQTEEKSLRENPDGNFNERLAEVLAAQGDSTFFDGIASDRFGGKSIEPLMVERYKNALELTASETLQVKLLCKLTILEGLKKTESNAGYKSRLENIHEVVSENKDKNLSLCLRLTEAMIAEDDDLLRDFVERFELSVDPDLLTQEALDLRLFALERLIVGNSNPNQNTLPKDWRLLDSVLSNRYLDADACVYLNRFFDLAIRTCVPTDFSQLVKYSLHRLGPQGATGERWTLPPGATFVGFYFSFWSDANGFVLYYPDDRQKSQRFELPYNRAFIKGAIRRGESLLLDETLVSLVRQDINAGVPIVFVWDDTACWADRRDALSNDGWPFDQSISIDEILGEMK